MDLFRINKLVLTVLAVLLISDQTLTVTVKLSDKYQLTWVVQDDKIEFDATVETLGYVGLGISRSGGMADADIVVAGVYPNGTAYISDRYATQNGFPPEDTTSQDYTLIAALENSTHTRVRFSRLRNTCDPQDNPITANTQKLIWSYGNSDTISYHGSTNRGVRNVNFLDPEMPKPDMSQFQVWNLITNATMPSLKTTYWCTMHKTPPLTEKHHMVAFDVFLNGSNAVRHSHHIDVYKCEAPEGQNPDDIFGPWLGHSGVDCYYPEDPFPVDYCEWIQYGWAIGGDITVFPNHTGFPFYGNQYFMLEIHYDNPEELEGVQFETGMTAYYTDELRPIDAAQFLVGSQINFTQMIPPNAVNFVNVAHCSASCTNEFPEEGITVYNILLHSHFSGRKMKARLWRDGVEMPWIINDESYDFNYQQNRPVQEFKLYRGDHITVECTYDTTWKNGQSVIGGRATSEEMCMVFFFYYPRMPNLVECNSEMPAQQLLNFLGIESVFQEESEEDATVTAPEHLRGLKLTHVIENIFNWTSEARAEYQRKHRYEPQNGVCWPDFDNFVTTYPQAEEWTPPNECEKHTMKKH